MANDWTPTEADALPWGETVDVRKAGSKVYCKAKVLKGLSEPRWFYYTGARRWGDINGTEWRHINERMD